MREALALTYRPKTFEDLTEQGSVVKILTYMIENKCFPNVMLFCGSAGCGKTTSARVMANYINHGEGIPIEIDAASNNSVEDIRRISEEAKFRSLDSEYKVYILDEVHSLSSAAWQASLKLFEEPPEKTIFFLCTTDPQKIPNTILSRVQRFEFTKITYDGILTRLKYVIGEEVKKGNDITYTEDSLAYIAKIANGGMRDALTNLDKCLNYSMNLTVDSVIAALGVQGYEVLFELTNGIINKDTEKVISIIEDTFLSGKDLKQFVKDYLEFLLDLCKFSIVHNWDFIKIPRTYEKDIKRIDNPELVNFIRNKIMQINLLIKWESNPKILLECSLLDMVNEL